MRVVLFAAPILLAIASDAKAGALATGNDYYLACKDFASQTANPSSLQFDQGKCVGVIDALLSFAVCRAPNVTLGQASRVVVAFMDKNPSRTNEDFVFLALEALAEAWPCKGK